ncbi:hypothetical protein M1N79_01620 [Dehalococcoidia bacterium]|nr:hypothetical protein [Dehalococcoidia bacterium]
MVEILWHRRETRRQMENTNFNLQHWEDPAYSPGLSEQLLDAADIKLPEILPCRRVLVATL